MHKNRSQFAGLTAVLLMVFCIQSFAHGESPVRLEFDKNSERIDIKTGEKVPDYTRAKQGSVQFFLGRLDSPEKGFHYFFDGRRYRSIEGLAFIRKMPGLGCWTIVTSPPEGTKSNEPPKVQCEIIQHAVSFIPLNDAGQPERRVYVLLDDLHKIQWADYDHWIATDTQEELEAKQGVIY